MKIVLVTPDVGGKSGWSRYALDLGRELAARGHEIDCIVAEKTGVTWGREHALFRQPTSYLGNPLLCFFHAMRLRKTLARLSPDVTHFVAEPYALTLPFMRKGPWKTVLTVHGTYSVVPLLTGGITRALATKYYAAMDRVVSVSEFTKNYLRERDPSTWKSANLENKTTVIHNAISLDGIQPDTASRTSKPSFQIISVSAVKRKKGYVQSLRAIRRFLDSHPTALRYDIIGNDRGDPTFTAELRSLIDELQLNDVVRFRGSVSDAELDEAYRAADLFLLPSLQEGDYFEGFGLVFIEANARGTPCIGGNTGGCPEAIKNGMSGYVCDPGQTESIATRMADVLINGTIDRTECRKWAEEHDVARAVEAMESCYAAQGSLS